MNYCALVALSDKAGLLQLTEGKFAIVMDVMQLNRLHGRYITCALV